MADAGITVAPNEAQNMQKLFEAAIKGIEKTKAAAADFGKEGNILTRIYGTSEQASKSMSVQDKLEKQLETKTVIMDRLTKKMKEYWVEGNAQKWELVRSRLSQVSKEYEGINDRIEQGNELLKERNQEEDQAGQGGFLDEGDSESKTANKVYGASKLARKLGGGDEFADAIDQIGGVIEQISKFDQKLGGLKDTILSSAKAGSEGKTGISAFIGGLKGGVGGLAEAGSTAMTALGPLGVGMIAFSATMGALNLLTKAQNEAVQKEIELRHKNVDSELEYQDLVQSGNSDQLEAEKKKLEAELQTKKQARDSALAAEVNSKTFQSGVDKWRTVAELGLNRLLGRADELTTVYGANIDDARDWNKEIAEAESRLKNVNKALDPVKRREEEQKATENLTKAQEDHISALEELAQAEKDYSKQVNEFKSQQEFERSRQLEDQRISDVRAQKAHDEEIQKMKEDTANNEKKNQEEFDKTILKMREESNKAEIEAQQSLQEELGKIDADLAKQKAQAQKEFDESELESRKDHEISVQKAEAQYQKERLQRIKDAGKAMLDAELANDVNAYIAAQQSAKDDLEKMQQDKDDQAKQDEEDFKTQQTKSREQFEKQQRQADEQAAEQRQQAQESYEKAKLERQKQLDESIDQEKIALKEKNQQEEDSLKESLLQNQKAWDAQQKQEQEDRELAEKRRKEDLDKQLKDMEDSFKDQTDALKKRDDDALRIIEDGGKVIEQTYEQREANVRQVITSSYKTLINDLKAIQASTIWSSPSSGGGSSKSGFSPSSFDPFYSSGSTSKINTNPHYGKHAILAAEGVVVGPRKPTLIVAGEGENPEMVLPLTKSGGIPDDYRGGGKPVEVHYHGNISIGDGVSEDAFREEMQNLAEGFFMGLYQSRDSGGTT